MRVVVDAMNARLGGGLEYAFNQIQALRQVRPNWELVVLTSRWNDARLGHLEGIERRSLAHSMPIRTAYQQLVLPLSLRRRANVLYCLGNFVPILGGTPCVVTQQNALYFGVTRDQQGSPNLRRRVETAMARSAVRRADAVIAISHALANEISRDGLPVEHCSVIPTGAPALPKTAVCPRDLNESDQFLLSLANDAPHKRLDDLVQAWIAIGTAAPSLVLAGLISQERASTLRSMVPEDRRGGVKQIGPVQRPEVRWLLEHANALVVTSGAESFGLTTVEAGQVGCPLVLTDIPAHREVATKHASYFAVGDQTGLLARLNEALLSRNREVWTWPHTWLANAESLAEVLARVSS